MLHIHGRHLSIYLAPMQIMQAVCCLSQFAFCTGWNKQTLQRIHLKCNMGQNPLIQLRCEPDSHNSNSCHRRRSLRIPNRRTPSGGRDLCIRLVGFSLKEGGVPLQKYITIKRLPSCHFIRLLLASCSASH
jgi:hypothetical protein